MNIYKQLDESANFFLRQCQHKEYLPKTSIIKNGSISTELFYIISGSVKVIASNKTGKEIVLAYLNPGDYFGEICLFDEHMKRSAEVRAKTKCKVAKISYDRLKAQGDVFHTILFNIASQLAFRLRITSRRLRDLAFTDVQGRIAKILLDLCQEPDAESHAYGIKIKITRKELGHIAGCSREMAGRVLKNLEEEQLIVTAGRSIIVSNPQ